MGVHIFYCFNYLGEQIILPTCMSLYVFMDASKRYSYDSSQPGLSFSCQIFKDGICLLVIALFCLTTCPFSVPVNPINISQVQYRGRGAGEASGSVIDASSVPFTCHLELTFHIILSRTFPPYHNLISSIYVQHSFKRAPDSYFRVSHLKVTDMEHYFICNLTFGQLEILLNLSISPCAR